MAVTIMKKNAERQAQEERRLPKSVPLNSIPFASEGSRNSAGLRISRPILPTPARLPSHLPAFSLALATHNVALRGRSNAGRRPFSLDDAATRACAYRDGRQARKIESARCAGLGRSREIRDTAGANDGVV